MSGRPNPWALPLLCPRLPVQMLFAFAGKAHGAAGTVGATAWQLLAEGPKGLVGLVAPSGPGLCITVQPAEGQGTAWSQSA